MDQNKKDEKPTEEDCEMIMMETNVMKVKRLKNYSNKVVI
jgi:hypothetical protein